MSKKNSSVGVFISLLCCCIVMSFTSKILAAEFPQNGPYQVLDKDNHLIMEWNFKDGKKDGVQKLFAPNGMPISTVEYHDGKIVEQDELTAIATSNFLTSAGKMLQDQGKLEGAAKLFNEALNVRPENENAKKLLGELSVKI